MTVPVPLRSGAVRPCPVRLVAVNRQLRYLLTKHVDNGGDDADDDDVTDKMRYRF